MTIATREWTTRWVLDRKNGQWRRGFRQKRLLVTPTTYPPGTIFYNPTTAWIHGVLAGPKVDPHRVQVEIECDRLKGILFAATGNEGQRGITEADRERDTYYAIPIRHRCDSRFHGNWFVNR